MKNQLETISLQIESLTMFCLIGNTKKLIRWLNSVSSSLTVEHYIWQSELEFNFYKNYQMFYAITTLSISIF